MDTAVIIDGIVAAALVGFVVWGAYRGLLRSVAGLVLSVAVLVGAGIFANAATPVAAGMLQPVIEKRVEARVDQALGTEGDVTPQEPQPGGDQAAEDDSPELADLLSLLGIDDDPAGDILESAKTQVRDTGVDLITAVVESVAESILHVVLFTLAFVVLMILLQLAVRALDLVAKLPVLHTANALGGGAVGLIEGALAVFLAVWVLRRFGVSFDTAAVAQTHLLRFFTTHTPLSALSFL